MGQPLPERGSPGRSAFVAHVSCFLPECTLGNDQLAAGFPQWSAERIYEKTGIRTRRLCGEQNVSDLAFEACESLFSETRLDRSRVDLLLLCTECPDYPLPPTACIVQHRLRLPTRCAAFDFNLGCSGYVYGLAVARAMVENGLSDTALVVTSEAYSKYIHAEDASVRTLFGDGASATLVQARKSDEELIGPFVFGTDGSGAENLLVRPSTEPGLQRGRLFMNGPELFTFALQTVPRAVEDLLRQASLELDDVEYFVFHQANLSMIEHLRKKIGIPKQKFAYCLEDCGNTVSTSIPLALRRAVESGAIRSGMRVVLVGFGVGYSWAAAMIRWA